MDTRPVHGYRSPSYPTQGILAEHPELLRLVPERWRRNRLVLTGLGIACSLALAGCRMQRAEAAEDGTKTPAMKAAVAPIFEHGGGLGSVGCVVISPPVFLTEEEARAVIVEEAQAAGLALAPDAVRPVEIEVSELPPWFGEDPGRPTPRASIQLTPDLATADGGIEVSFVSTDDYTEWPASQVGASSVTTYRTLEVARLASEGLSQAESKEVYGVLYDPCADMADVAARQYGIDGTDAEGVDWSVVMGALDAERLGFLREMGRTADGPGPQGHSQSCRDALAFIDDVKVGAPGGQRWRQLSKDARDRVIDCLGGRGARWDGDVLKQTAEELLREQVRDFVAWLKAEGIV